LAIKNGQQHNCSKELPMHPSPSFDTWTIVFLIAAAQGFFVALVLWRWRRGHRLANRLLALLTVLFSVTMIEYVLFWTHYMGQAPHLAEISAHFPLLYGPIIWLYLRSIYTGKAISRRDAWQVLPFVLAVGAFLPWYILDAAAKREVLTGQAHFPVSLPLLQVIQWLRVFHLAAYALWNAGYIRRQPVLGATARWATLLNVFFMGFILAYAAYFVLVRFSWFNTAWDYHISAAMAAFIYLIAYAGYVQPAVFEGFNLTEAAVSAKYKNSGLTTEASRSLLQRLDTLMAVEKLYRDPTLSLDALAARLEASKHHVSQVINAHRNANFFEYLNHLRIEEAKCLLAETTRDDLHVIEVAYAVGFNNKVSFNTVFKKTTGLTPTAYRKSHGQTDTVDGPQGQAPY
jgi:AraC-like DNA-binding protein